jgi:hypothetical protein
MARSTTALLAIVAAAGVAAAPARARAQRASGADRSWNAPHIALASAFSLAVWMDAAQTRAAMGRGYRETNPILGPDPSVGQVNTYTALAQLTVLGAAAALPARLRPWLLGAALAVEAVTIAGTVRKGVAIRFP